MNKREKRKIIIGTGLGALALGFSAFFILNGSFSEKKIENEIGLFYNFNKSGNVALYNFKDGKKQDELNLVSQFKIPEQVITIEEIEEEKIIKNNPLENFETVEVIIEKGSTVWENQIKLTPNENIFEMIKLIKTLNKESLSMVPAGDKRTLLQYKSEDTYKKEFESMKNDVKTSITSEKISPEFLYAEDKNKLYAYTDASKTVYEIEVSDNKLKPNKYKEHHFEQGVKKIHVNNGQVFLVTKNGTTLYKLNSNGEFEQIFLVGEEENSTALDGVFLYSNQHSIFNINDKGETKTAFVGGKIKGFEINNNTIYALNDFGYQNDNSILYKINPETLEIQDLTELHSNQTALLGFDTRENSVLVGKMQKILDKKTKEEISTPVITNIDGEKMTISKDAWGLVYSESMKAYNNVLYAIEDGNLKAFNKNAKTDTKSVPVSYDYFSVISRKN